VSLFKATPTHVFFAACRLKEKKKKEKGPRHCYDYVCKLQKMKTKRFTKLSRHDTTVIQVRKVKPVKTYPASATS